MSRYSTQNRSVRSWGWGEREREEEEGEGKGEGEEKWKVVSDVGRSEFPRQDSMTGPSGSYNNQVLRGKGAASFY
jgi:hypothetical protein